MRKMLSNWHKGLSLAAIVVLVIAAGCGKPAEESGTELIVSVQGEDAAERAVAQLELRQIIDRRLRAFMIDGHSVNPAGEGKLSVKLPGLYLSNPQDTGIVNGLKNQIAKPGKLAFRLIHEDSESILEAEEPEIPEGYSRLDISANGEVKKSYILSDDVPPISVSNIANSEAYKRTDGTFKVTMTFDEAGTKALEEFTSNNIGRSFAIVLDDNVYNVLNISQPIPGGQAEISGLSQEMVATQLVILFNSGELPGGITVSEPQPYGPQPES